MKKEMFLPLALQFFAGEETEETQETGGEESTEGTEKTYTDEDVQKMLAEKLAEAESDWQKKLEEAKTEGEKLAKMSKEDRQKHEEADRLAKLEAREAAVALRELESETKALLAEKQIDESVVKLVLGKDAAETKANIDTFKTVFDAAVQKAVEARLAGRTPRTGAEVGGKENDIAQQFKKALGGM